MFLAVRTAFYRKKIFVNQINVIRYGNKLQRYFFCITSTKMIVFLLRPISMKFEGNFLQAIDLNPGDVHQSVEIEIDSY